MPWSPKIENTDWDKLTARIELTESRTRERLAGLIATIPQSIQKAIRSVKDRYAYREYTIDGRRCQYMGMKAEWNQETEEISSITLHLKNDTAEYALQLVSSQNGEYTLFIAPKQGIVSIEEPADPVESIKLLTRLWVDQVDTVVPKKSRKIVPKSHTRTKDHLPSTTSVSKDGNATVVVPQETQEWSEQILKDHFPQFEQRIAGVDVLKVYGRQAQDRTYEMVFDIKESSSLIIKKENNGAYAVSAGTPTGLFDYYAKDIINIWKTRERRIVFNKQTKSVSLPLSERQSFIDRNPGVWFSFHPHIEDKLVWKNETVTIAQAKAIGWFHDQEFDFGGGRPRQKLIATKKKDSAILWLQRADSTESDYFVVIVNENGDVTSSISRNRATPLISTTATPEENAIIEHIRQGIKPPTLK